MKVLQLISSGGMYGAESVILGLSHALQQQGVISTVAVFGNASLDLHDRALAEGLPALQITCARQVDPSTVRAIRRAVEQTGADVVHAHGYKADLYALFALRGSGTALVSTCHGWIDNDVPLRLYGAADRIALKRFSRVVAVSDDVEKRLLRSGVSPQRIRRIRNGVIIPELPVREAQDSGLLHVGLVGRLSPEKGIDVFLHAAKLVVERLPRVRFTVFGEGPQRPELESLVVSLGLKDALTLAGRVEDMRHAYPTLDLLVSASRQEGLPMALLEGMASGLPVVATAVGEVPSLVQHRQAGLVVPPEDAAGLANAMLVLLNDGTLRRDYGRNALRRVEQDYSVRHTAEEYRAVYAEALAEVSRP